MFRVNSIGLLSAAALFLASAALNVFSPSVATAQGIPGAPEPITIVVSSSPVPNSTAVIRLQSFSVNLDLSNITWTVNGKVFKEGRGVTSISVPTGAAGQLTTISAGVTTTELGSFFVEATFRPASVTLLWKSDGYIPPFYKGKALENYGSVFRVAAIPEFFTQAGARIDPKTLVYTWSKNGTIDAGQSGYGKDHFTDTQTSFVRGGDEVTVTVANASGDLTSTQTVTISPSVPDVVIYEDSPLYGVVFERALNDALFLESEEVALRAEPFNMSLQRPASGLATIDWSLNGIVLPEWTGNNGITLRKTGEAGGSSLVGVTFQHLERILQAGQSSVTIIQ